MNMVFNRKNDEYIHNFAYIKAFCIKAYIEAMDVSYEQKMKIREEVLDFLKKS